LRHWLHTFDASYLGHIATKVVRDVVSIMPCDMHKGSDAYKAYKEVGASKKLEDAAPE